MVRMHNHMESPQSRYRRTLGGRGLVASGTILRITLGTQVACMAYCYSLVMRSREAGIQLETSTYTRYWATTTFDGILEIKVKISQRNIGPAKVKR